MSDSFFFIQSELESLNLPFLNDLRAYAKEASQQIYVVRSPLTDDKYNYDYEGGVLVLAPKHKLLFIDNGDDPNAFEEYVDEFTEDLASLSDKYRYKDHIGRPKVWKKFIEQWGVPDRHITEKLKEIRLDDANEARAAELLISLVTGSINDVGEIGAEAPESLLDRVKKKILLFDGEQTRFIYQKIQDDVITIQGLSGTGKTELLLHKLKELYVAEPAARILFTCHNRILAANLKKRIPSFFNFMKVEQQILWNERLWCVHAWGSENMVDSGAYRYITHHFKLPFFRYSRFTTFDNVCKQALQALDEPGADAVTPAFDYILLDESQDFPESFISLCRRACAKKLFVAGDIFQNIFEDSKVDKVDPQFLLNKCYRTDPRTLMFAHGLGLGLFEKPKLRWLRDADWENCGYLFDKTAMIDGTTRYVFHREPLRRFEDVDADANPSVELIQTNEGERFLEAVVNQVITVVNRIRGEHPTVKADDIGVILIDYTNEAFAISDLLAARAPIELGLLVNQAHTTKEKVPEKLFVSNLNNVKGLEFPFVIVVTRKIQKAKRHRNALYMALTRSFIKSFLLVNHSDNVDQLGDLTAGLDEILKTGHMTVTIGQNEATAFDSAINVKEPQLSLQEAASEVLDEMGVAVAIEREQLLKLVETAFSDDYDLGSLQEFLLTTRKFVKK